MGIMDELIAKVKELEEWPSKIRDTANSAANSWLAKQLGIDGAIISGGNFLADKTLEFCTYVKPITYSGSIESGMDEGVRAWRKAQEQWSLIVANLSDATKMNTDSYWKGASENSYKAQKQAQINAARQMAVIAKDVADSLSEVKETVDTYIIALACAVASALVAVVAAAVGAEVPPSAPVAFSIAVGLVGVAITAAVTAANQFKSFTTKAAADIQKLEGDLANIQAFPNNTWPSPNGEAYAHKTGWALNK